VLEVSILRTTLSGLAALAVLAAVLTAAPSASLQTPINPVGTYSVSSMTDTGQPMTGTLSIRANGRGYAGEFTSAALPAPVKVESVTTNGQHMMMTLNNGQDLLLVWVEVAADGSFKGTYHQLSPGIPATGRKEK
jgi:hypothetical protein